MNIRESIHYLTEKKKYTQWHREISNRIDWCSNKAHQMIQRYDLIKEFGISEENINDQLILFGFLYKKVLQHQAKALEHFGKADDVSYLLLKATEVDQGINENVLINNQNPGFATRVKNLELASNFFFHLATFEIQGQLGLNTNMTEEKWDLWRNSWGGKI
jgi:cell fate (sporulation/competence/biofilm development) regulator YmcA (YheA/YmcA/DUF963 family)